MNRITPFLLLLLCSISVSLSAQPTLQLAPRISGGRLGYIQRYMPYTGHDQQFSLSAAAGMEIRYTLFPGWQIWAQAGAATDQLRWVAGTSMHTNSRSAKIDCRIGYLESGAGISYQAGRRWILGTGIETSMNLYHQGTYTESYWDMFTGGYRFTLTDAQLTTRIRKSNWGFQLMGAYRIPLGEKQVLEAGVQMIFRARRHIYHSPVLYNPITIPMRLSLALPLTLISDKAAR